MSAGESEAGPPTSQPLIPSLPDDVALNCLARVPILHHPVLAAVSRPIRALLSSPLFFAARAHLGAARPLLHLSLRSHQTAHSWFVLHRDDSAATALLAPLPPLPAAPSIGAAYAVSGHQIYSLGGSVADHPSPRVWVLDCRARAWRPGPAMRVAREFAAAASVSGRVYVLGGCAGDSSWARSAHWAEALDVAAGEARWVGVPSPPEARDNRWMHASAVVGSRVFAMADRGGIAFDPSSGEWGPVSAELDSGWRGRACVIDRVLYCYDYLGKIRGFVFDPENRGGAWKELKGVGGVLPKFLCGATMANVGGRLMVAWEEKGSGGRAKGVDIWCAEIEIEVDPSGDGDLLGTVRWSSKVLSVPAGSSIIHCVAVSL